MLRFFNDSPSDSVLTFLMVTSVSHHERKLGVLPELLTEIFFELMSS